MTCDYTVVANEYIEQVLSGAISGCKWTRLACERQRRDLELGVEGYHFDQEKASRVCKVVELLPHIKGKWAGSFIALEPWQVFILITFFGWVDDNGHRRYKTSYIEVPRKNAKSTLSSGVGIYATGMEGEGGAEVYSAATTRDQARIVWQDAKRMVEKTPGLKGRGYSTSAHSIYVERSASSFKSLSAEGNSLDGLNIHCGIIDELHAHKTRTVFDVIETATGSREQPILWLITTAGSNRAGICYEQRSYLTKILEGVVRDDSYFGIIYTIDDGDDWTDPAVWRKANPNYGVSVNPDDMARLCRKAMEMPSAQNNFLTKRLNVWVNADTAWMNMVAWDKCGDPELMPERFAGERCWVAIDLASKIDIAAMVRLYQRDGHYYVFGNYYLPEETIDGSTNSQYSGWSRRGLITATPGNVIDFGYIEDDLRDFASENEIIEVPYDPFQATQFATRMLAEGVPMVEYGATVKNFSEPMKQLEALVLEGKIHFDGDPVLTWMMSNVVAHLDAKENIFPRKERPENKIDGVVALIMALGRAISTAEQKSVYETHGIRTI